MLKDAESGAKQTSSTPAHASRGASWGVHGLRRLGAAELAGLCRGELESVLGDIERVVNRLAGYRVEVLGALDALNATGAGPDGGVHQALRDAAGVSQRDARRMVRIAAKAREHGEVLVAMSDGDITPDQAEALCDARVPEEVRAELVGTAAGEDTDATRRRIRRAEVDHTVETSMERFERQRKARGPGWQRDYEGMLRLWAKFDPAAGAQIEAALETLRREYWADDKQLSSGRRTPAQRDADVLAYALGGITATDADAAAVDRLRARARPNSRARGEAADGEGSDQWPGSDACCHPNHGDCLDELTDGDGLELRLPPAQLSVLIGLDALRGRTDEVGLTDAGTELPPEIVRKLACDAEIIPVILGDPGGSADVGRARRTVPRRLRRLLIARDRHCRWPGCHAPPSRCDAHHIWHWSKGGPTNLDNLVLLCHTHHHHLHEHGLDIVPQPDGTWTVIQQTEPDPEPQQTPAQARAP
ncbi:MAG: DUF222 domain-containing protein [Acidimicrobiaceae bacterium]|nr:DUF222 domain-containing protein [Acidimicrobiaceae bacterium]